MESPDVATTERIAERGYVPGDEAVVSIATPGRTRGRLEGWTRALIRLPLAEVAHYGSLAVAFPLLLHLAWHDWFFGDDWDFLVRRGLRGAELGLFQPHNEHWSTAPILIYRALFHFYGARTYLPYVTVVLLLHVAAAHVTWRLMRQAGTSPWLSTTLAITFLIGGAGAENFMWSFQIGFVGALLFGLLTMALANHTVPSMRRERLAAASAVFTLLWAGVAVPMVATAGVLAWIRRGWRAALRLTLPATAVYLIWLKLIGSEGLHAHQVTKRGLLLVPSYCWRGLITTVQSYTTFEGTGAVILLALGYAVLVHAGWTRSEAAGAQAGFLGAVLLFLTVAPGRVALGVEQADSARYHYTAWALLLPSIGVCLHHVATRNRLRELTIVLVLGACALGGFDALLTEAKTLEDRGRTHRRMITAAAELAASDAPVFPVPPHRVFAPDLAPPSRMVGLIRSGALPRARDVTNSDRLSAMAAMELRLPPYAELAPSSPPAVLVRGSRHAATVPGSGDCITFSPDGGRPEVDLTVSRPGGLRITSASGGELRVLIRDPQTGLVVDPSATVTLTARTTVPVDLAITGAIPVLVLPDGTESTVCGVLAKSR